LDWIGLDWIGLDWIGLDWIGLDWIGLAWIGLAWLGAGTFSFLVPSRSRLQIALGKTGMTAISQSVTILAGDHAR
jgi:hypothetical protein